MTHRGVIWSTQEDLGVVLQDDGSVVSKDGVSPVKLQGTGTGEFSSNLTNLEPDTKYYVRAFGVNSEGVGSGDVLEFETGPQPEFTLTLMAEPEEGGSVGAFDEEETFHEGGLELKYNQRAYIEAETNEGYNFENWKDEEGNIISHSSSFEYTMEARDVTLTANFSEIPLYTLTLIAKPEDGGTVEGSGEYERWEFINITATPNFGYEFVNWTDEQDNVIETDASFRYQISEDATLTANFRVPDGVEGTVTDIEGNEYNTIYT